MLYGVEIRRMGDALTTYGALYAVPTAGLSLLPSAVEAATPSSVDVLASLNSADTAVSNFLWDAMGGNLSPAQIAAQTAANNAAIAQASAGNTALATSEQAQALKEQQAVDASGYYSGASNLLNDLGLDSTAPPGTPSASTTLWEWMKANYLLLLVAGGAFVIFRPDKTLFGRR